MYAVPRAPRDTQNQSYHRTLQIKGKDKNPEVFTKEL